MLACPKIFTGFIFAVLLVLTTSQKELTSEKVGRESLEEPDNKLVNENFSIPPLENPMPWSDYLKMFPEKKYTTKAEEAKHREAFEKTREFVHKHNWEYSMGLQTFKVEINEFADWTEEQDELLFSDFKPEATDVFQEEMFEEEIHRVKRDSSQKRDGLESDDLGDAWVPYKPQMRSTTRMSRPPREPESKKKPKSKTSKPKDVTKVVISSDSPKPKKKSRPEEKSDRKPTGWVKKRKSSETKSAVLLKKSNTQAPTPESSAVESLPDDSPAEPEDFPDGSDNYQPEVPEEPVIHPMDPEMTDGSETGSISSNDSTFEKLDWEERGYVTEVRSQSVQNGDKKYRCGSCFAQAVVACLEVIGKFLKIWGNELGVLSPQNIVDCDPGGYILRSFGGAGCWGGHPEKSFKFVRDNGIAMESDYPYVGKKGKCRYKKNVIQFPFEEGFFAKAYYQIPSTEAKLKDALKRYGPIVVSVKANVKEFKHYSGVGVLSSSSCAVSSNRELNHAMLVVGAYEDPVYGSVWKVKNSWGTKWGKNGYLLLSAQWKKKPIEKQSEAERKNRKGDMCGISRFAIRPNIIYKVPKF